MVRPLRWGEYNPGRREIIQLFKVPEKVQSWLENPENGTAG
jgi:hypothetical protein